MVDSLRSRARSLRRNSTDAEKHLWYLLRAKRLQGYKFKRQFPVGNYIVDFVCIKKKLIIELDGGQHALMDVYDKKRTDYLNSKGYQVLRFWNSSIFKETDAVVSTIIKALDPLPALSREEHHNITQHSPRERRNASHANRSTD